MINEATQSLMEKCGALRFHDEAKKIGAFDAERLFFTTAVMKTVAKEMAQPYRETPPDIVVGVEGESMICAYELANQLGAACACTTVRNGTMTISRRLELQPGWRAVVAVTALRDGRNVRGTIEILRALGLSVLGISCAADLSGATVGFRYPLHALVTLTEKRE